LLYHTIRTIINGTRTRAIAFIYGKFFIFQDLSI
jgi:hypothetical protein